MRRSGLSILLVGLFVIGTSGLAHPVAAQDGPLFKPDRSTGKAASGLDLSAMTLTPLDLADLGMEGYRFTFGATDTLDEEFVGSIADTSAQPLVQDVLEDAGFVQSRWTWLTLTADDDPDEIERRVAVFVDEYTEPDALPEVLEIYLDLGGESIQGSDTIGDESHIVAYSGINSSTGDAYSALVIGFIYENQIGQIEIADYTGTDPELEEIEALGIRMFEKMESVREDGAAGLDSKVLRFTSDGRLVYYESDYYTRYDDEPLAQLMVDGDQAENLDEAERDLGITDSYSMIQSIGVDDGERLRWSVQVMQFGDGDAAEAWVDDAADWLDLRDVDDIEEFDDGLDLGESAVAMSYVNDPPGRGPDDHVVAILVQVGDIGFIVELHAPDEAAHLDLVTDLAEMQIECVTDGCPIESPMPDELIDLAETL